MSSCYRRSAQVASRVIDGEAVLVQMPESRLYVLGPAASRIWVEADGTRPLEKLAEGRDTDAVRAFLDEMVELGLLEGLTSPAEEADVYPQEVVWPEAETVEPPRIAATEPMGVMAGCALTIELLCDPGYLANS